MPNRQPGSKISFFDLPPSVRKKVYRYTNVVMSCPTFHNESPPVDTPGVPRFTVGGRECVDLRKLRFNRPIDSTCHAGGYNTYCVCLRLFAPYIEFHATHRRIFEEVNLLCFSEGHHVVNRCGHNGFEPLFKLKQLEISCITSLQLEINSQIVTSAAQNGHAEAHRGLFCSCRCNQSEDGVDDEYPYCICNRPDQPMNIASKRVSKVLSEFERCASLLARYIKPGQLDLGIICDCENLETARSFSSAMEMLPRLRNCSVRFSADSDDHLRQLAQSTVRKLTGNHSPPVDVSCLPEEIQIQIFENMGLVAPIDLEWKGHGFHPGFNLHHNSFKHTHMCQVVRGWSHSDSSFASSCSCWKYPATLFTLNKAFRAEAIRIFYGKNHFIILPDEGYTLPIGESGLPRMGTEIPERTFSNFLKMIPQDAIQHLQSIQFALPIHSAYIFPLYEKPKLYEWSNEPRWAQIAKSKRAMETGSNHWDWLSSLRYLARHVQVSKLTLILDFATLDSHLIRKDEDFTLKSRYWSRKLEDYTRSVITSLNSVGSLRRFHIYVPESIANLGIETEFERHVAVDDKALGSEKFRHPNRCTFWFAYLRGIPADSSLATIIEDKSNALSG